MKKQFLLIFIFCIIQSLAFAADTLRLAGPDERWIIEYLSEYKDCSKKEAISSLLQKFKNNQFTDVKKGYVSNVVNRGITNCNYWFALTLHNESDKPQDYLWNFYNEGIRLTLYEADEKLQIAVREESVSHHIPRNERSVPLRSLSFRISMMPGETKTLLVKTEPIGRKNLYFPTDISTEADILWWELDYSFLLGRYYGFFFFAAIFNFCLFVFLRKRFYGVMLGYVLSLLSFNLVEYLHDLYIIPNYLYPLWSHIPRTFFLGLTLYFNVKIFQDFIQLRKHLPVLNKYLNITGNVVLVSTLLFLLFHVPGLFSESLLHNLKVYFNVILLIQVAFLLVGIILSVRQKIPYVWHYLGGNSLLFGSMVIYLLNNTFKIIHLRQFVMPGNMILAFAFEVVYLMIIFSLKYKKDFDEFSGNLAKAEKERTKLTTELISIQEKERMRVAQDIHDGIGGSLQAFRLLLGQEKLENQAKLNGILKDINTEFKHLIHQLSPRSLKTNGLFATIEKDVSVYGNSPLIKLNLIGDESVIPWEMKINVYRIYQELLTNALKHAVNLSSVIISVAIDEDEIRLMIEDDGKQKIAPEHFQQTEGSGIANIRSRIAYYSGEIYIESTNQGTSIIINIPIYNSAL